MWTSPSLRVGWDFHFFSGPRFSFASEANSWQKHILLFSVLYPFLGTFFSRVTFISRTIVSTHVPSQTRCTSDFVSLHHLLLLIFLHVPFFSIPFSNKILIPTIICFQKSASLQPRSSPPKLQVSPPPRQLRFIPRHSSEVHLSCVDVSALLPPGAARELDAAANATAAPRPKPTRTLAASSSPKNDVLVNFR